MAAGRIQTYIRSILVGWLDWRVLKALVHASDREVDDSLTARTEAFLETQSGQMLDYTARNSGDRRIQYRFPTPETDDMLRAYLRTRWDRHAEAGTLDALDFQTQRYGFTRYTWVDELSLRELGYTLPFGQPLSGLIGGPPYSPVQQSPSGYFARDGRSVTHFQMWPNAGDPLPGGGTASVDYEPGPGTGFFAVILHPPHYFTPGFAWDSGKLWDEASAFWDFGAVAGYPVPAKVILDDYATLIRDFRPSGSSLRHIVVDFVGDCVVDPTTPSGYAGTNFTIYPVWEPAERLPDGTYPSFYNSGWRSP